MRLMIVLLLALPAAAAPPFVQVEGSFALTHVKVMDGTGAPPAEDQTLVVEGGKITAIGPAVKLGPGMKVLDRRGFTVLPGLVGMHDHLFFPAGWSPETNQLFESEAASFPQLYLAAGVTTIRTTGGMQADTDLAVKKLVD